MRLRPFSTTAFSTMTAATTNVKTSPPVVNVNITSDLMCPWCWVGLKKLQAASQETGIDTSITWKPFLLRPNLPQEGVSKGDGTPESRVGTRLKEAGTSVGINFTGLTDRTPNTIVFHATMKMLQERVSSHIATRFQEAAFEAYFTLGVFPDKEGLLQAARNMEEEDVESKKDEGKVDIYTTIEKFYKDKDCLEEYSEAVKLEAYHASSSGVTGVPFFDFNGRPAFSGAQSVSTFASYLNRAVQEKKD